MDITNSIVFACTMIRNPRLALRTVRQLYPDREPRTVKVLVGQADSDPIVLTENSSPQEIERAIVETEKTVLASASTRGARFDLYFEDDEVVIVVEMQREAEPLIVNRAVFISSILSAYLTHRGASYFDLKQMRVAFICLHDPFGFGECYNPIELRLLRHTDYELNGTPRIDIFFAGGNNAGLDDNIKELMAYLMNPNAYNITGSHNDLIPALQAAAQEVLKDGRVTAMVELAILHEESMAKKYRQEGLQEGLRRGRLEEKRQIASTLLGLGYPYDDIIKTTGCTWDQLDALKRDALAGRPSGDNA
ncbi:MAG: hypothetical protein LBK46_08465 [Oscillospiraceae bacterium]|jgi:predicted transposase/invertase (TIGR01784 family)|nr:hypothetical protein [Oscillospiraceae bacterium]